jgi:hypothetical protein
LPASWTMTKPFVCARASVLLQQSLSSASQVSMGPGTSCYCLMGPNKAVTAAPVGEQEACMWC